MKRCPECRRDYYDETLLYCLDDGNALLDGPASMDGPATAILSEPGAIATGSRDVESTQAHIHTTDHTAIFPGEATAKPPESLGGPSERQGLSAHRAAKPLVALLVAVVILVGSFFGYRYFASSKQIESIAVMPFVNESGNADVEYLSDGMTETLISRLSQLPNLNVKARSSVFRYKGKEVDAKTLGKELNVQALVTGRVVQRGDQLTLSLELVDVETENALWSQQYSRKQSELVSLQSEIAKDVSSKLKAKLSGLETAKLEKKYTNNNEAYQLYLKGRYFGRQLTLAGFHKSVECYKQAIAIDPNFALAYAGLSHAYFSASTVHLPPLEALPKAEEYARKALEHDDTLAAAHHSIANVKSTYDRDYAASEREYERSIELDPNESTSYMDYGYTLALLGEFDKAIAMMELAQQIDPLAVDVAAYFGAAYVLAGRYDKGLEQLQAALKLDDRSWWAHYWMGIAYNQKGMFEPAIESLQTAAKLDNSTLVPGVLAHALARGGHKAEAQKVIDELLEKSKTQYVSPSSLFVAYSGLGDREKAFAWLEKSYKSHDEAILFIKHHPMFNILRDDARYQEMLKRLNLPE